MKVHAFTRTARDAAAMVMVVADYHLSIAWPVHRQLRCWRVRAARIADPVLREMALGKLRGEYLHSHAAAVFATNAPRRHRRTTVELLVSFEVMYDYLDAVSESPAEDQVENGRQLHRALAAAIDPAAVGPDFYAADARAGDGGYLDELAAHCRACLDRLPAGDVVRPFALRAAERCGTGQTRTHAVESRGIEQLRAWASTLPGGSEPYHWWELAAGAAASLALHALFAAAADPATTAEEARRLDAAYFPSVCALAALLDSLIDHEADRSAGAHSFVGYYPSADVAARRLSAIAREGVAAMATLRHPRRHAVIATGVAGFYLSDAGAHTAFAAAATRRVVDALDPFVLRPILAIAGLKRRLQGVAPTCPPRDRPAAACATRGSQGST